MCRNRSLRKYFSSSLTPLALEKHCQQAKDQAQKHQFEGIGRKRRVLNAYRLEDCPRRESENANAHYYHCDNNDVAAYAMIGGRLAHVFSPEAVYCVHYTMCKR